MSKTKPFRSKGASTRPAVTSTAASMSTTATRAGQEQISTYLEANPTFLENYVLEKVDLETLERWVIRKAKSTQKDLESIICLKVSNLYLNFYFLSANLDINSRT